MLSSRKHHLPLGVPAGPPPGQEHLPPLHQVDPEGEGHLQTGGLQGRLQAVGQTQEQAGHELRDHGAGTQVSVCVNTKAVTCFKQLDLHLHITLDIFY